MLGLTMGADAQERVSVGSRKKKEKKRESEDARLNEGCCCSRRANPLAERASRGGCDWRAVACACLLRFGVAAT